MPIVVLSALMATSGLVRITNRCVYPATKCGATFFETRRGASSRPHGLLQGFGAGQAVAVNGTRRA
jgi:hypothetical protein